MTRKLLFFLFLPSLSFAGTVAMTTGGTGTVLINQGAGSSGGSGITALTGDVTASGTGSVAATAASNQPNINTFSASSVTVQNVFQASTITATQNGAGVGIFTNAPIQAVGNANAYLQTNIQNQSNGSAASSDYVATSNLGGDTSNYVNIGIQSNNDTNILSYVTRSTAAYAYSSDHDMIIGAGLAGTDAAAQLVFVASDTTMAVIHSTTTLGYGVVVSTGLQVVGLLNHPTIPPVNSGDLSYRSASEQMVYEGASSSRTLSDIQTKCMTIDSPTATDNYLMFRAYRIMRFVEVDCMVNAATSALMTPETCDANGANCTNIASQMTCGTSNTQTTSFTTPTIIAGGYIRLVLSTITGTVGHLSTCITMREEPK